MAGHDRARNNLGHMESQSGNMEQAVKHWKIAASAGHYTAMHQLTVFYEKGYGSRKSIVTQLS
jgi:TPR repeat protein